MSTPRLLLALLALCAALALTACGGSDSDDRKLIAQSRADALLRGVDRVQAELSDNDCPGAVEDLNRVRTLVDDLPKATDNRLVANLTQWVDHLEARVPQDCEAAAEEPTVAPTTTPEPEETETPSPTATPDETKTPEPTPDETVTPEPTPDSDSGGPDEPDTGGAAPEGEG